MHSLLEFAGPPPKPGQQPNEVYPLQRIAYEKSIVEPYDLFRQCTREILIQGQGISQVRRQLCSDLEETELPDTEQLLCMLKRFLAQLIGQLLDLIKLSFMELQRSKQFLVDLKNPNSNDDLPITINQQKRRPNNCKQIDDFASYALVLMNQFMVEGIQRLNNFLIKLQCDDHLKEHEYFILKQVLTVCLTNCLCSVSLPFNTKQLLKAMPFSLKNRFVKSEAWDCCRRMELTDYKGGFLSRPGHLFDLLVPSRLASGGFYNPADNFVDPDFYSDEDHFELEEPEAINRVLKKIQDYKKAEKKRKKRRQRRRQKRLKVNDDEVKLTQVEQKSFSLNERELALLDLLTNMTINDEIRVPCNIKQVHIDMMLDRIKGLQ